MTSEALRTLPQGSYVEARLSGGERETVRLLSVKPPTDEERRFGHTSNRVWVRRFLVGGYLDFWLRPMEVLGVTEPSPRVMAFMVAIENEVGAYPREGAGSASD